MVLISNAPALPPSTETFVWVTQIIESYNGFEERHRVRTYPRMSYSVTIPFTSLSKVTDIKTRDDKIREEVEFVLWHAIYEGENRLRTTRGHPWYFEFGTDSKVAHYYLDNITISKSVSGAGYVYPVRDAIVHGALRYTIRRGGGTASINYNVQEAVAPPTGTFNTLAIEGKDYEVLEMPTKSGFTQAVNQQQGYFDSVVGSYIGTTRWRRPKLQWQYTVEMFFPIEVLAWKQFLFRREGKLNPVALRDTDGRVVLMRLSTDTPSISYDLNYFTSSIPLKEVFV